MHIHEIIKIKYSTEGYLPNYPPHLISEDEMLDAFIVNNINYFDINYPLVDESLDKEYQSLKAAILYHINSYRSDNNYSIPDWIYSYMLGECVGPNSNQLDRHYLLVGVNADNPDDTIDATAQHNIYEYSKLFVNKLTINEKQILIDGEKFMIRPPTMFGEPHIIKMIRLREV